MEGVTAQARKLIDEADLSLGADSTLKLLPKSLGKQPATDRANLDDAVQQVTKAGDKIVVLASGDPLFYWRCAILCDNW